MEYYHPDELGLDKGQLNAETKKMMQENMKEVYEREDGERKQPQRFHYEFSTPEERDEAEKKIIADSGFNDYFRYLNGEKIVRTGDRGLELNFTVTTPKNEENLSEFFKFHNYQAVRTVPAEEKAEVVEFPGRPKAKPTGQPSRSREAA